MAKKKKTNLDSKNLMTSKHPTGVLVKLPLPFELTSGTWPAWLEDILHISVSYLPLNRQSIPL